jgi:hypothetical protein
MDTHDDLGPFGDITHITRMPDGALLAFDKDDVLIAELDENGVDQLRAIMPEIKLVESTRDKAKSAGFGQPYGLGSQQVTGVKWLSPVRVKTTGPVFLGYQTCPEELDGEYLRKGDRILVTHQPDKTKNGLYYVWRTDRPPGAGATKAGHSWLEADDKLEDGSAVMVNDGDTYESTVWAYDHSSDEWFQMSAGAKTPASDPVADALALLGPPDKPKSKAPPKVNPKTHPDWPKLDDGTPLMTLDEALEDMGDDIVGDPHDIDDFLSALLE